MGTAARAHQSVPARLWCLRQAQYPAGTLRTARDCPSWLRTAAAARWRLPRPTCLRSHPRWLTFWIGLNATCTCSSRVEMIKARSTSTGSQQDSFSINLHRRCARWSSSYEARLIPEQTVREEAHFCVPTTDTVGLSGGMQTGAHNLWPYADARI